MSDQTTVPSAASSGNVDLISCYGLTAIRLWYGAWMFINGINHWIPIFAQPMGHPGRGAAFLITIQEVGLFDYVKWIEIIVGVALLVDLFVPLALVAAMPIAVIVWYNHAILGGAPFAISMGNGCLFYNIILLAAYLRYYLPMLSMKSKVGSFRDLEHLPEIFRRDAP